MKYTITFNGNDKKADGNGPSATFADEFAAITAAEEMADGFQGHTDFIGGQFDVDQIDGDDCERIYSSAVIQP